MNPLKPAHYNKLSGSAKKVAVGLSGGVDSSVAAALLKEQGYDVIGISMEIYDSNIHIQENGRHSCYGPGEKDEIQASATVCKQICIPFYTIDLRKEYQNYVIEYFRNEYLSGRTPNPCIVCNHKLKFGFLLERAQDAGIDFDFFATGHYARITTVQDHFYLKKSRDRQKDQTYFMYTLASDQLARTLFPLGEYTKSEVRKMADAFGLETANHPESQDFISGGDISCFFYKDEMKRGPIVEEGGNILGSHQGIMFYTIGQRKGLGIASPSPLYVKKIDAPNNRIVVDKREGLFSGGIIATDFSSNVPEKIRGVLRAKAKIRLNHQESNATIEAFGNDMKKIIFDEPQLSITPGQSVVLYEDDIVLGGGIIKETFAGSEPD